MKNLFVVMYALFFLNTGLFSQNIDSTIARYAKDFAQERTYLQYDKAAYAPGETIWFKAYIMQGINPADESKNFYTDWTDDKGNLLSHIVGPVEEATTNGQFDIPADYTGRFIHVKAYTKWMLNFDSSFLYQKDIFILSKNGNATATKIIIQPTLTFFPEGGDAAEGVSNKIAFKANDQWGRPVKIKGIIKDNNGKTVDSLRVLHDGMGYFFLVPQAGQSFTAKWSVRTPLEKDEKGTEYNTPLPAIKPGLVSLQVAVKGTKRNFIVNAPPDVAAKLSSINIIGTLNQYQVFKIKKDISSGTAQGIIPTQDLPSGILTITVFDAEWKPLAERITYINNQEYLFDAQMSVEHWGLNKRARNDIMITVPDSLPANFAISVTDQAIDADSSNNIISHLLLTSDIKGQVYNPWYYFLNNSDSISQNLDLVMLTHGWRRFKWEEVVKNKMPVINFKKDTSYLSLSGRIYGATPSQLRDNASIVLIMSQKNGQGNKALFFPIKADGTFNDPTAILFDTMRIYYKLSKGISDVSVTFLENRLPALQSRMSATGTFYNQLGDTTGYSRHFQLSDETTRLLQQYEGKTLENVVVTAKVKPPLQVMDEKYSSGLFSGGDNYQFDLINDKTSFASRSIFDYLQAKVAGLQINTTSSPPTLTWRGGTPDLFLNETPVDADFISTLPVSDIAYVKVFRPPFMGSFGGGSYGAIAVYTRRGDDEKGEPGKGLSNNMVTGYSLIKQFYSPNYSNFTEANEKKDFRTTLYWNPQVHTTLEKNKVMLSFYNNDVSKSFRVIIEGMSSDGRLIHIEQIME